VKDKKILMVAGNLKKLEVGKDEERVEKSSISI